jgi:hypothetical protein
MYIAVTKLSNALTVDMTYCQLPTEITVGIQYAALNENNLQKINEIPGQKYTRVPL